MTTIKQKRAFKEITEKHRSVSGAMRDVGYAKNTCVKPQNLTESKGFQELLEEAGLTDDFLNKCLYDDIKTKEKNRKPELELAYKLKNKLTDRIEMDHKGEIDVNIKDTISKFYGKSD